MNREQLLLSERQQYLIDRAARQRATLRQDIEPWRVPLKVADQSISTMRYLRRHPHWIAGIVILVTIVKPSRVWEWLGRGLIAWQTAKALEPAINGTRAAQSQGYPGGVLARGISAPVDR